MDEKFLHFIWKYQNFEHNNLKTTQNEQVLVIKPGLLNQHSGPDFSNAKIRIGNILWNGHVEIHIRTSDWKRHQHTTDKSYNNVVMHVVWNDDAKIKREDGSYIPTIELKNRVDPELWSKYLNLVNSIREIPCAGQISKVEEINLLMMKDNALGQRLESKSWTIRKRLKFNINDWEETVYQQLCMNFGFKVNQNAFLDLSKSLPLTILMKQGKDYFRIEALLFGMAGFLNGKIKDTYFRELKKEFQFLRYKYKLPKKRIEEHHWRFLRLRPANFPTIRISQLAMLLYRNNKFLSMILETEDIQQLRKQISITQSEYWQKHYHFGKKAKRKLSGMGEHSLNNLLINTIVPVLYTYGRVHDMQEYIDRSLFFLENIKPENNKIIRRWKDLDIQCNSAFDSQALIELFNNFCLQKKCLSCKVGFSLMKR